MMHSIFTDGEAFLSSAAFEPHLGGNGMGNNCRRFHDLEDWREKFLLGAGKALRTRPRDEEALKEEQIKKLEQKIGGSRVR
jgi:hypothetical protein